MARIKLLTEKEELPADRAEECEAIVELGAQLRGPHALLLHSPGLALKVVAANHHLRRHSTLVPKERELAILAVAREGDSIYVWARHVDTGRNAGLSEETIAAVRDRGDVSGLEVDDRDLITYVRQLGPAAELIARFTRR